MNRDDFDLLKNFIDTEEPPSYQNKVGQKWKSEIDYSFPDLAEQAQNISLSSKSHFVYSINHFGVFFFVKTKDNDSFNMSDVWMPYYTTQDIFKEAGVFKDNSIERFEKDIAYLQHLHYIQFIELEKYRLRKWWEFWK